MSGKYSMSAAHAADNVEVFKFDGTEDGGKDQRKKIDEVERHEKSPAGAENNLDIDVSKTAVFVNNAFDGYDYEAYCVPPPIDRKSSVSSSKHSSARSTTNDAGNACTRIVERCVRVVGEFFDKYGGLIKTLVYVTMVLGYAAYFGYALWYKFGAEPEIRLLWITMLVVVCFVICIIADHCGTWISSHVFKPCTDFIRRHWKVFKIGFILVVVAGYVLFLVFGVGMKIPYNLISFCGLIVYLALMYLYSHDHSAVIWRPVLWGLGLQFVFALLVLGTTVGYEAFKWLGDRVQEFMAYSDAGAIFVFGDSYQDHFFAFKILPVIIYFSAVISTLYYMGVMQAVILKIAWVMQRTLGTTAGESVNAAGNIFIGQTEAPLLIRPLIGTMTSSELHAVIVGGYGTIAGSVMATYMAMGVPANHLISASIMAAPCALALSKLCYPETEKKKVDTKAQMEKGTERNFVEAAASGAIAAIPLCANIAANLIAFIALLEFVNQTLIWFGERVGIIEPPLTFQLICSYLLWPFAFVMGVVVEDCSKVAELMGIKVFLNEFVAYSQLSVIISNSDTFNQYTSVYGGNWTTTGTNDIYLTATNTTLVGGVLQERSIVISTYALCGFANISSIGSVIGALSGMVPHRRSEIAYLATRALLVGNVVSLMNACTAGLMYQPGDA